MSADRLRKPLARPTRPFARARHVLVVTSLALASALALGCFRHSEVVTTMGNPFVVGGVMPNEIQQLYASTERNRALPPGSMTDKAVLTQMDANAVCFQVELRALDEGGGQTWTDLRNWDVSLLTGEIEMVEPSIELYPPTHNQYNGRTRQQVQVGQRQVCVDDRGRERPQRTVTQAAPCTRWETRPITESRWVPAILTVTTASANVCFQNQREHPLAHVEDGAGAQAPRLHLGVQLSVSAPPASRSDGRDPRERHRSVPR